MRNFRSEDGYVMVLALIAMPLLLGFSLLIIDIGRGNNLHTDLQNAVDSLALAGARELDGGTDAIDRAKVALETYVHNQARFSNGGGGDLSDLGGGIEVTYDADSDANSTVVATFLDEIPANDDLPIDADWIADHETADGNEADYLMVTAKPHAMTTLFPIP